MEIRTLRDQFESDKRFLDTLSDRDRTIMRNELSAEAKRSAGYRFLDDQSGKARGIK